jgi:enediyne polyketide synthase
VAALAREDGAADVVLRSDETGYTVDHFTACFGAAPVTGRAVPAALPESALLPGGRLYGAVFFHGPRFRRVAGYRAIAARRCVGVVDADPAGRWFGAFLDGRLTLGDPGARDAFLHLLQVCVPDRRVLPVRADRIRIHRTPAGRLTVHAEQRSENGPEFTFDVLVTDVTGAPVEEWSGLRLRAVHPMTPAPWPLDVVGAQVARELSRSHPSWGVDLAVAYDDRTVPGRSAELAAWLAGEPVTRAADGRLTTAGPRGVSASHLGDRLLVATGSRPVGVDWELIGPAIPAVSPADVPLADRYGAHRVWTCREVLRKLGRPADAPLIADGPDTLVSGSRTLISTTVQTTAGAVAICVGAGA